MSPVAGDTPGGEAYLELRRQARASGRNTEELLQLYVLEAFLARLAASRMRDRFVLKGGVLLAALDARRPTRDIDLAGLEISNDAADVLDVILAILEFVPEIDDGVEFDPGSASAEVIREEDEYAGVRVTATARLATARLVFNVDVNVGDPIWPEPTIVHVPRLRGGPPIVIAGYPLHMIHAEKVVTAIQRGTVNTRWRDFADIWTLARRYPVAGNDLRNAIEQVALYRRAELMPLREALAGYADLAQDKWVAWRRRGSLDYVPESFGDILEPVIRFADPVIDDAFEGRTWDPDQWQWR